MTDRYLLALDQGTTSTGAMLFDAEGSPRASAQAELPQIYPQPGWVEHDPEEIWRATVSVLKRTVSNARVDAARGGLAGRPDVRVPEVSGLYVVGDWVGPEGLLSDASLSSAARAADAILGVVASSRAAA